MKRKLKAAVRDPQFTVLIISAAVMISLGVAAALIYGSEKLRYVLQGIYASYAVTAVFFVRAVILLYKRHFRQEKPKKQSKIKTKLKAFFKAAEEKLRRLLDMKPKYAYFGGEDEQTDMTSESQNDRKKHADARIKWSSLRQNGEKVRFLYAERIKNGNDSGAGIVPADTARQAREKLGGADARDDALIAAYERVRYSADPEIDDGTVSYLSDKGAQAVKRKKK